MRNRTTEEGPQCVRWKVEGPEGRAECGEERRGEKTRTRGRETRGVRGAGGAEAAEQRARGRAQLHIRFDHCLEGGLALPVCKLVHEVARHTGRVRVEPKEAVVVAQGPGCPERQGVGHTRVRLQLPRQVRQLRGDVCGRRRGGEQGQDLGARGRPALRGCASPPEFLVKM